MKTSMPKNIRPGPEESIDEFMSGRLRLIQPRCGYRFSIDAVLLSEFVTIKPGDRVVDLGTGCGVIPLLLLLKSPISYVLGLEIQPEMAGQAARNVLLNGFGGKMGVVLADIRNIPLTPLSVDVVTCNPPYRQVATGRINPNPQRAIARHEILMVLDDILNASKRVLKAGGRLAMIYPSERVADLLSKLKAYGLEPKRMRFIHPDGESGSKLVLVEAYAGGRRGVEVLPPLIDPREMPTLR